MFHDLIWSSVQPAFRNLIVSGGRNAALLFVGLSAGGIIAARSLRIPGHHRCVSAADRKNGNEETYSVVRNRDRERGCAGKYCGSV